MQLQGQYTVRCTPEQAWQGLMDPDLLHRTIPGCVSLEEVEPDVFAAEFHLGVAAVKGSYKGRVEIVDKEAPAAYALKIAASGTPGFVEALVHFELHGEAAETLLRYSGDAQVGGPIASVGQRVVGGVAKLVISQFFAALTRELESAAAR